MSRPSDFTTAVLDTAAGDWTELAVREGDGLEISLHWSTSTDRVKVSVLDQRLETSFDIHVAGAHALSAFYHPFAYDRGSCSDADPRATADLQTQS